MHPLLVPVIKIFKKIGINGKVLDKAECEF